jgi:hypothetical protein
MNTPWDALQRAHFNDVPDGAGPPGHAGSFRRGNGHEETDTWKEGTETWRVLRAYFSSSIETHSLVQDFFFGDDLFLRGTIMT